MDVKEKRIKREAQYMIETGKTIREIARNFGVSKSTVHKDLHERLRLVDYDLYLKVDEIIKYHTKIRHIRGGMSTKQKYTKRK